MVTFAKDDIQGALDKAVQDVLIHDSNLLNIQSSERGVVHWLAIYFDKRIREYYTQEDIFSNENGYVVDVEYNRFYKDTKHFYSMKSDICNPDCNFQESCRKFSNKNDTYAVTLDMIFHKRQANDNILCVEVKTTSASRNNSNNASLEKCLSCDKQRVKYLTSSHENSSEPTYQYGATIYIDSIQSAQIDFWEHKNNANYLHYTLLSNGEHRNEDVYSTSEI